MEDILNKKNLKKYITEKNFKATHETLDHIVKTLKNKNSKLFTELNNASKVKVGGKAVMPSEYFGSNSGNYNSILNSPPTEVSTPNALSLHTRPSITSNVFPLSGGCSGVCGIGMSGGGKILCNCPGNHHRRNCSHRGGCSSCLSLFRHSDIKNISNLLNIPISKKDYGMVSEHLSIQLKNILNDTFSLVKNKDKLIGKSHINKSLK